MSENIYGPAGMSASGSLTEEQNVPNRSIGYTRFGGNGLRPNTDTLPYRGTSAGGGYSTVEDLLKFANVLASHKVLDARNTELLTTGKVNTARGVKYAFGFMDDDTDPAFRHFGHGGGAPGMNGELEIYPQSGYGIAVLSNLSPPAGSATLMNMPPRAKLSMRETSRRPAVNHARSVPLGEVTRG